MNNNHVASSLGLAAFLALGATSALAQFQGAAVGGAVPLLSEDGGGIVLAQAGAKRKPAGRVAPATTSDPAYIAADAAYKAYDQRDYETAIGQAREATRLAPANRAYWQLLVNSLIAARRLDEADAALSQGLQAGGDDATLRGQREPIRRAMAQAAGTEMYRALVAGDLAAADRSARAAVQLAPDNAAYRLILINLLLRGDQFVEAEKLAGETVALLPESAVPLALRGYARQRLGRWSEARADMDRALQQPGLGDDVKRNLRLIAADSALAAREPQRALELLQALPEGDEAVGRRRAAARGLAIVASAQPSVLTTASFPPPTIDCATVESVSTCALIPGQPPRDPAYDLAAESYRAMEARDFAQAADKASQAVAISPGNRDYQRLLLNAQLGAGRLADAEQAATAALVLDPTDAGLLAQRGSIRKRLGDEAGAAQDLEAALATGRLPPAAQVGVLADLGRNNEARDRLAQFQAGNQMQGASDLDLAYLAARVGDEQAAREAFARADAAGQLPASALQDSAYASLRAGRDDEAVNYFKRTVDAADSLKLRLEPQILFNTRRAIADITREGGVTASLIYRGGGSGLVSGFGAAPQSFGGKTAQVGVEAWWRPFGYRNGRYVEIFARGFQTLYSQAGGATGGDSLQTALGLRWKPFSQHNAVLSLSRVFSRGAPDDWLAQAAYSLDLGTDLRVDVDNWWTTRVAAEIGRYTETSQSYGLASVQVGKSYRMPGDGKTVLFPHGVAAAEYNSVALDKTSVAAGPGVSLRHWFREDKYAAPRSYVDFSLQYRFRVAGDDRAKGLFLTSLISY